ncbi:MAG: sugar-binding transcriptional regulator [Paracoccus sp. (in: a-proteobacteria)]|uniref:sugar-binding transcriptional regulator n=1 Tax=Paracoccus sp. TaxID=267 RepID=UPI0026E03763|nr:sugar-binding transcriptional regulator [Paracoccus sp. (in: a-proteobacteria)]MDO5631247.1 sugar-binding transcriptional regulator [Paracoccus sp. (in: a-proteobacteria)]
MAQGERKLDQAAQAAWLSYVAGLTQDEIAREMGVSRQTAQRLVAQAMASGMVKVRINHPLAACLDLAESLKTRFGLRMARVAPAAAGITGVAMAVADLIETELSRPDPITLAIGTGRTLRAAVAQMSRLDCPRHRIVSLTGNIAPDGSAAYYNVLFSLSEMVTAPSFPLMVPVIATSPEERAALHRQPGIARVMEMAQRADVAVIGLGAMGAYAPLVADGFLSPPEAQALRDQGAVGEILGRCYDSAGGWLPADGRVASARLPGLDRALVAAAAYGPERREAALGALRGGLVNGVLTDTDSAAWLLAQAAGRG